jgi:hypothetical protein
MERDEISEQNSEALGKVRRNQLPADGLLDRVKFEEHESLLLLG